MFLSNSKMRPPKNDDTSQTNIFTLSIKSKQKAFCMTEQKNMRKEQERFMDSILKQPLDKKNVSIEECKDLLKGERIYLELYHNDKVFASGYEPYIEAMGGEVMKRLRPSTTIVLTNQITFDKYQKLKSRVNKVCSPQIVILSFLWLEQIYRQKRKVEKQLYLFDEKTDVVDWKENQQQAEQDEAFPEYFEHEVFKQGFLSDLKAYLEDPRTDSEMQVRIVDSKKIKKEELKNPNMLWIDPQKINIFKDQQEYEHYKQLSRNSKYRYFWPQKNDKKKQQQKKSLQNNRRRTLFVGEKDKRRRTTSRRSQKIEIEKIEIKSKIKIEEAKEQSTEQNKSQQTQSVESDSQFLRRIRQKKETPDELTINGILDKYLKKPDDEVQKQQRENKNIKRLSDINELAEDESYVQQVNDVEELDVTLDCPQRGGYEERENFQRRNEKSSKHYKSNKDSLSKKSKQGLKQSSKRQRQSILFTQQKGKASRKSCTDSKPQLYSKTKSMARSSSELRQRRINQLQDEFKMDIDEFLQSVGYLKTQTVTQSKGKKARLIYNIIVKQPYIISRVNDFNNIVKQKLNLEVDVFFNIIEFKKWNKSLSKASVLKFFINFKDLTEDIVEKKEKSKKIQIIKQLFELNEISEYQAISNYEAMCDLVMSEQYRGLDFYYLCNKKNKEEVLMGYLSDVEKKNVLDYNVLKIVFEFLSKKEFRASQLADNSQEFSFSRHMGDQKQGVDTIKDVIQNDFFTHFRIKARLTAEIITGKRITCIPVHLMENVEFVVKKLKTKFIPIRNYMSNIEQADIVINDRRSFSKGKNIWQPDYQTFINSLIVIE